MKNHYRSKHAKEDLEMHGIFIGALSEQRKAVDGSHIKKPLKNESMKPDDDIIELEVDEESFKSLKQFENKIFFIHFLWEDMSIPSPIKAELT
jgi:hypothetical protein